MTNYEYMYEYKKLSIDELVSMPGCPCAICVNNETCFEGCETLDDWYNEDFVTEL